MGELRGAAFSGDWRNIRGSLEMPGSWPSTCPASRCRPHCRRPGRRPAARAGGGRNDDPGVADEEKSSWEPPHEFEHQRDDVRRPTGDAVRVPSNYSLAASAVRARRSGSLRPRLSARLPPVPAATRATHRSFRRARTAGFLPIATTDLRGAARAMTLCGSVGIRSPRGEAAVCSAGIGAACGSRCGRG
jgi:hypothetical protein